MDNNIGVRGNSKGENVEDCIVTVIMTMRIDNNDSEDGDN